MSARERKAREECSRRGVDPDDICADGGIEAWMVVDQEMMMREEAAELGRTAALENLREAWAALAMIRETIETLGPIGAVKASEHLDGPTFMHEAEALVAGIRALAASQSAAPLGGLEALARMIRKALVENWRDDYDGRQWDEDVLLTGCRKVGGGMGYQRPEEAAQRLALDAADAILAAIPQERGVERDGEADTYDDDGITHASTYDEGITYAIMQLAELTGSKDWQIRDGSEDHATDVQDTIMDVLKCAGLYDDETGKLATIATTTANVVAGTDRAAIIAECALRLDESAIYEDRHIEAIKKDHGLSETGRESLIEHAVTRRTAFRQGALSIRQLRALAGN